MMNYKSTKGETYFWEGKLFKDALWADFLSMSWMLENIFYWQKFAKSFKLVTFISTSDGQILTPPPHNHHHHSQEKIIEDLIRKCSKRTLKIWLVYWEGWRQFLLLELLFLSTYPSSPCTWLTLTITFNTILTFLFIYSSATLSTSSSSFITLSTTTSTIISTIINTTIFIFKSTSSPP